MLQGTSLNYDDATLLDKLEYALRVGGPAAERHMAQADTPRDISVWSFAPVVIIIINEAQRLYTHFRSLKFVFLWILVRHSVFWRKLFVV